MHKITATGISQAKEDYTVGTQAAATLSVGDGELMIGVGTNVVALSNQYCISALGQLADALREARFPDGAGADNYAYVTPPDVKLGVTVGNAAAIPVLTEDEVIIAYGGDFANVGGSQIFLGHISKMIEKFKEQILLVT